ncbi:MAG: anthranilate synthase component I [Alphaproteobacteria bacterium]|nr:anthranilate synthase component I [Alphaproteobacteria bacterium]
MTELTPTFDSFRAAYDAGKPQIVARSLVADLDTPVSAWMKLGAADPYSFLFESVQGGEIRGRYSIIGLRPDIIWRCRGTKAELNLRAQDEPDAFVAEAKAPLASLRDLLARTQLELPPALPPMVSGVFGYLGHDMVRLMERLPAPKPDTLGLPDAVLVRPTIVAIFDAVRADVTIATPVFPQGAVSAQQAYDAAEDRLSAVAVDFARNRLPEDAYASDPLQLDEPQSNTTRAEYHAIVARAKAYIAAGDIFQVVPSQRFRRPFTLPPLQLYRALRRLNPSPYLFFLNYPGFSVVGSSPEILVRVRDGGVTIRPIAGTIRRGAEPTEDKALAEKLLADPKERAEHLMLLDLGRNDVGRVAVTGTVNVTEQFVIEKYSHVQHIVSQVEGRLRADKDAVDALIAGFPNGTTSGAPKIRALEIIDELEKEKRGIYGGAVGYFSANGAMDTCIALRTAIVKDGMMYVQAGGGVVADSDPEAEFMETVYKSAALFRAAEEAQRSAGKVNR